MVHLLHPQIPNSHSKTRSLLWSLLSSISEILISRSILCDQTSGLYVNVYFLYLIGRMKLFRRILGFAKDEEQHHEAVADARIASGSSPVAAEFPAPPHHLPRKGFSVPVQVPVERAPLPPLLLPCPEGDGGLQGLNWYARRLRIDEDGDVADEFLDEDSPDISTSMEEQNRPLPRFKVKYIAKHAKVKKQELLPNGKIQHLVEHHGRLEWV